MLEFVIHLLVAEYDAITLVFVDPQISKAIHVATQAHAYRV